MGFTWQVTAATATRHLLHDRPTSPPAPLPLTRALPRSLQMYTPPYVILLPPHPRGIGQVDLPRLEHTHGRAGPSPPLLLTTTRASSTGRSPFNIYEVALPWAATPAVDRRHRRLRSSVLTDDGRPVGTRTPDRGAAAAAQDRAEAAGGGEGGGGAAAGDAAEAEADAGEMSEYMMAQEANKAELDPAIAAAGAEAQAAQAARRRLARRRARLAVGRHLRRIGRDLRLDRGPLTPPAARPMRRLAVEKAAEAIVRHHRALGCSVRRSPRGSWRRLPRRPAERWCAEADGAHRRRRPAAGAAVARPDESPPMQGVVATNGVSAAAAAATAVLVGAAGSSAATAAVADERKGQCLERAAVARARRACALRTT